MIWSPRIVVPPSGLKPSGPVTLNGRSPLAADLVMWFNLDERFDGHNLAGGNEFLEPASTSFPSPAIAPGFGVGWHWTGLTQRMRTLHGANPFSNTNVTATVALWVTPVVTGTSNPVLVMMNREGGLASLFSLQHRNTIWRAIGGDGTQSIDSSIAGFHPDIGVTRLLVFRKTSAGAEFYVDGVLQGTSAVAATSTAINSSNNFLSVGGDGGDRAVILHDVKLWSRYLDTDEIASLYAPATRWELHQVARPRSYFSVGGAAYTLAADSTTYTLTGSAAAVRATRTIAASSGSYSLTGFSAALQKGYKVAATAGSYVISGTAAALSATRRIAATAGSYVINGFDATLTKSGGPRILDAALAVFIFTGSDAALRVTRQLAASAGAYTLSGSAAALKATRRLAAEVGSYTLNMVNATLTYSGAVADSVMARLWRIPGMMFAPFTFLKRKR